MSFGNPRQPSPFTVGGMADEQLANQLALYKAPATIRDMKQTYFYVSALSDLINIDPLLYRYGIEVGQPSSSKHLYYGNLGTTRRFNIADKVNELIDIRVPKDKYVIEINLVECAIEADIDNWAAIPDRVLRKTGTLANGIETVVAEPTYVSRNQLTVDPANPVPPRDFIVDRLSQATKSVAPQTLYCKIKELSNGEPYNWSVTNSGNYSIDKMHQMLVRHGDVNYANLTLEFGHMVFTGRDEDEIALMNDFKNPAVYRAGKVDGLGAPVIPYDVNTYRNYKYLDYNSETFNTVAKSPSPVGTGIYFRSSDFPSLYKGEGGIRYGGPAIIPDNSGTNLTQSVNRPPFYYVDGNNIPSEDPPIPPGTVVPYNVQGKPLLFNQQVNKLGFRFLVRIIHMF